MAEPLIDYVKYQAYYSRPGLLFCNGMFLPTGPKRRFRTPMGSFKTGLLAPTGQAVRDLLIAYLRRPPTHQGAARGRVYFKWLLRPDEDRAVPLVAADEVRDRGYDVTVTWPTSNPKFSTGGVVKEYLKIVIAW